MIDAFWQVAQVRAGLNPTGYYTGELPVGCLPPTAQQSVDLRVGRRNKIESPHMIKNYVTDPVLAKVLDHALRGML